MREPLDQIGDHAGGARPDAGGGYNRPNQPWVCGNAETGEPCPLGPAPNGRCGNASPCTPVRSMRSTRGRIAIGAGVFLAGALAMLLGSGPRANFLAPGPLTHAHARLMDAGDAGRCANCHPGGGGSIVAHAAGALVGHGGATQSSLCLDCHQKEFNRQHAMLAHGLPAGALTGPHNNGDHSNVNHAADPVACAACHQEHQGAGHNLATLTNHRCQSCHQQQFNGLAYGHPGFGNWPHRRRTRIAFDHARHEGIHFASAGTDFDCARCHTEGANGAVATLGYQASCAACHDEEIDRSLAEGVPVIALPTIDPDALAAAGQTLGKWPQAARGDYDGDLPAPMKLLLAADPRARRAIDKLGAGFSFYDLDPDQPADARHAANLAEATRELIASIAREGHAAIADRIDGDPAAAAGLSTSLASRAWWQWFGGMPARPAPPRAEQAAKLAAGGWFADPRTLSLRYAATGHADPVLTAWFDAAANLGGDQSELRDTLLSDLNRTGACLDCHSVDQQKDGRLAINWRSLDTAIAGRPFTRFAHTPHLTQPVLADCRHCHQFTDPSATPNQYAGHDPHRFVSHFQPIDKAACTSCHQPQLAGDNCTQCHNYHVDPPDGFHHDPVMMASPLFNQKPPAPATRRR